MVKIAYNADFGGFGLSVAAVARGCELSDDPTWSHYGLPRHDPVLVQVIEELGEAASSEHSDVCLREVPAGTRYFIEEYDGSERVRTVDNIEWTVAE